MPSLPVYVLRPGSTISHRVAPKSAVIGKAAPDEDGFVTVYFEGNTNNAANLKGFYGRMVVAAGRCRDEAGTVAMARVSQDDLRQVASFDPVRLTFTEIADHAALEQWAGEPLEDAVGVRVDPGTHGRMDNTPILNQVRQLGWAQEYGYMFRTWGGQILAAGVGEGIRVFEHDDPEIVSLLTEVLANDERGLAYAVGSENAMPRTPQRTA